MSDVREPLPGEDGPLVWERDRGPVTEDEALRVARRRRRAELARAPKTDRPREGVPEVLPDTNAEKRSFTFRLPERHVLFAQARAELEGVPLTAVVDAALREYAEGRPWEPSAVERRMEGLGVRVQRHRQWS